MSFYWLKPRVPSVPQGCLGLAIFPALIRQVSANTSVPWSLFPPFSKCFLTSTLLKSSQQKWSNLTYKSQMACFDGLPSDFNSVVRDTLELACPEPRSLPSCRRPAAAVLCFSVWPVALTLCQLQKAQISLSQDLICLLLPGTTCSCAVPAGAKAAFLICSLYCPSSCISPDCVPCFACIQFANLMAWL